MNHQTIENCLFFTGSRFRKKEEGALRRGETVIGMAGRSESGGHAAGGETVVTRFCSTFKTAGGLREVKKREGLSNRLQMRPRPESSEMIRRTAR